VRAVGSDPVVASFEPGWRGRTDGADTTLVTEPPPPDTTAPALDSAVAGLAPDEVVARMRQLAEDGMGLCPDAGRTGPEPR
jgi:hypothetical protein